MKDALKLLKKFEEFPSLRVNTEKSEACWIGRAENCNTKSVKCKWTSLTRISIKTLGICFSYHKALVEKNNFYNLSLDSLTLLNIWKQRWLSLAGKIQVFNPIPPGEKILPAFRLSSFITSVRNAAEPQNLVTFLKFNG